jgi:hypothetical protein
MPLLLWYLPFIILSGAYELAMDSRDSKSAPAGE